MKSNFLTLVLLSLLAAPAVAQPMEIRRELAAMEFTLFGKAFCKDAPIKRVERLEENFSEPSKQKEKDLRTRLNELMEKVKPTAEVLNRPDPCDKDSQNKKNKSALFSSLMTREPEGAWNERNYPYIKWRTKLVEGVDKARASLRTEFDSAGRGMLKYIFTIELPENYWPRFYTVTFLDEHGFKLNKFVVEAAALAKVPGEGGADLWQAKEQTWLPEKDYKAARDYSVTAMF